MRYLEIPQNLFKTEKEPKLKLFEFWSITGKDQNVITWKNLFHMLFGAFQGTSHITLSRYEFGDLSLSRYCYIINHLKWNWSPWIGYNNDDNLIKPRGGLQFIGGPYAHCYTIGESRLWFPCVDSNTELSTWTLEFTVDARLTGRVQNRSFLTTWLGQPIYELLWRSESLTPI